MRTARTASADVPAPSQADAALLPNGLCRPQAFPPPRPSAVSLASTHISWVFLTDHEVWKVKRPVNFGFLDYSDIDKRRRCCEDEARLGARTAPDVYLGVAPLHRGPEGPTFTGPGPVIDWAVRMRRLADEDSAAALARAGRLTPAHLGALAERLADFYARTDVVPELGHPDVLAANIRENHDQMQPYVRRFGRFVDGPALDHLLRWQEGALAAAAGRLRERMSEGRVREGHGDLRLEHVYFPDGAPARPLVIDPIEFNRRFRCLDVMLDVAFLAMELDACGQAPLAAFFLSRFARDTGDYGGYPLLDLYLSYRAWVRAKVACFVAGDPGTDADKARRKVEEAERLFALAVSYTRPRAGRAPVVAVGGQVGCGKSVLADALTLELGWPSLSSDATRKTMHGLRPTDAGAPVLYTEAATRRTYDELFRRTESVLASGRGAILDATFSDPATRAAARALAERHERPFLFVEVTCREEVMRARLRARGRHGGACVSDAREDHLPAMSQRYQPPTELPAALRLTVDGEQDAASSVRAVRQRLA